MSPNNNIVIPVSRPALFGNEKKYVADCIDSSWISSNGKYIARFEESVADYLGVAHAICCCNGTVAIHLALMSLGVGPGDEVIVPTVTFVATANAVRYTGATPVFIDCELDTWNLDPGKIQELITPKTRAVIPVPLYGHPCDMDPILEVARRNNIAIVEDAAEAFGAHYKGRKCGAIADISTFSFYGNKTITTGEGGMVVTDNPDLASTVRRLKGQGMDPERRYWFDRIGYNYRMTNIAAAIGFAQMENVGALVARRKEIASWYRQSLAGIRGIVLPVQKDYASPSYWMFSILVEDEYGKNRDELMTVLAGAGIETRPFFYPMHILPVYKGTERTSLRTAEYVASRGINLPTFYDLKKDEVDYIAKCIRDGR